MPAKKTTDGMYRIFTKKPITLDVAPGQKDVAQVRVPPGKTVSVTAAIARELAAVGLVELIDELPEVATE